jgi:hypothetical protein
MELQHNSERTLLIAENKCGRISLRNTRNVDLYPPQHSFRTNELAVILNTSIFKSINFQIALKITNIQNSNSVT